MRNKRHGQIVLVKKKTQCMPVPYNSAKAEWNVSVRGGYS